MTRRAKRLRRIQQNRLRRLARVCPAAVQMLPEPAWMYRKPRGRDRRNLSRALNRMHLFSGLLEISTFLAGAPRLSGGPPDATSVLYWGAYALV